MPLTPRPNDHNIAYLLTLAIMLPGLVVISLRGVNYSVEFTGGTLMQVKFATAPALTEVRDALSDAGLSGVELSTFGNENEFVLRAQERTEVERQAGGAESVAAQITGALNERFGADQYRVVLTDAVGPRVGDQLRRQAIVVLSDGHDTTSSLIGNSVVALLDHRDQLDRRYRLECLEEDQQVLELLRLVLPDEERPVRHVADRVLEE